MAASTVQALRRRIDGDFGLASELIQLSAVIGDIYDAATDPMLWQLALASTCTFVRGSSAALFRHDRWTRRPQLLHLSGEDPTFAGLYAEKYLPMHPMLPAILSADAGTVASVDDVMPHQQFRETPFYRHWAEPQGIADVLLANLEKNATSACLIEIPTSAPPSEDMRHRLAVLVPHLQRVVAAGRLLDPQKAVVPARRGTAPAAPPLDAIARRYGLTASEARVLEAVLEVNGVRAMAERLRLSQATVKTHLHKLFRKTGTGRQSDLVKLVAGL